MKDISFNYLNQKFIDCVLLSSYPPLLKGVKKKQGLFKKNDYQFKYVYGN